MIELMPSAAASAKAVPTAGRRSGPPFGEVLAAASATPAPTEATPVAPADADTSPAESTPSEGGRDETTVDDVLAGLTAARSGVDARALAQTRAAGIGRAEGDLTPGLTVARAAVAAAGANGTSGDRVFAADAVEVPAQAAPATEEAGPTEGAPIEGVAAAEVPASHTTTGGDPTASALAVAMTPTAENAPIAADGDVPSDATPSDVTAMGDVSAGAAAVASEPASEGATVSPPTHETSTAEDARPEVQAATNEQPTPDVESVTESPVAAGTTEVSRPPAASTDPDASAAGISAATAPTAAPSTPAAPAVAPTAGSTFVARLVDAATQLESAPAPREVVLDLRDVLGGDTAISIRLVRGEVHVSIRGEMPPGAWQRELEGSLAERGFDLGSFEQRDRSTRDPEDPRRPGEDRHPGRGSRPDTARDETPRGDLRPDPHADVRHAAGLRL